MKCEKCDGIGKYAARIRTNQLTSEEMNRVPWNELPRPSGMSTLREQQCEKCNGTGEVAE